MEFDQNLLDKVSDFLNTSQGADILNELKSKFTGESQTKASAPPPENDIFKNIDIQKLIPLVSAISSAKTDDRAANLLLALKPLLSAERRPKIDKAVSLMRIMSLVPILEEHGFSISDFF